MLALYYEKIVAMRCHVIIFILASRATNLQGGLAHPNFLKKGAGDDVGFSAVFLQLKMVLKGRHVGMGLRAVLITARDRVFI